MCMDGLLVIMAFGPLLGIWPSSFFVLLHDHGPRHFMLQNWSKTCKNEVPPKYMCKCENDQYRAEVRIVSDFDIKFMPLSKLNRG